MTASRSEYGLLRWTMHEVNNHDNLKLQIIATGSHLSQEYGLTFRAIEEDGFIIDEKVDMLLSSNKISAVAKSMGICSFSIADTFLRLNPDIIVVLGDRYELLPICSAALVMRIPVAHISGGDVTNGAIDNEIRNAVTQMASLHFPGTIESLKNIERMTGKKENIYCAGEPGIENIIKMTLLSRKELADKYNMDINNKWIIFSYHPETKSSIDYDLLLVSTILELLISKENITVVLSYSNADFGGNQINQLIETKYKSSGGKIILSQSYGQRDYLSFMNEAAIIVGNSSSAIVEAPVFGLPAINIGERQNGRFICENIISCPKDMELVIKMIEELLTNTDIRYNPNYHYGDGTTSKTITENIYEFLKYNE